MNFLESTQQYETWLGHHLPAPLIREELDLKHDTMASNPFSFLRATFYRWAQTFPSVCPELAKSPKVLAVGDLHMENFGTWRDAEGRLVWGINDFDEAFTLPYTNDLVRLATSIALAIEEGKIDFKKSQACAALLEGYRYGLTAQPGPLVLGDALPWLRDLAVMQVNRSGRFWEKANGWKKAFLPPQEVPGLLTQALPSGTVEIQILSRRAGLGSLGRPRYVALGQWNGDWVAREAKALVLSACIWALGSDTRQTFCQDLSRQAIRSPDPTFQILPRWIIRRLAPDQVKIEIKDLRENHHERNLLFAMGQETANLHRGSPLAIPPILTDLQMLEGQDPDWLYRAAKTATAKLLDDFQVWRKLNLDKAKPEKSKKKEKAQG